jgi:hypothetical protein
MEVLDNKIPGTVLVTVIHVGIIGWQKQKQKKYAAQISA